MNTLSFSAADQQVVRCRCVLAGQTLHRRGRRWYKGTFLRLPHEHQDRAGRGGQRFQANTAAASIGCTSGSSADYDLPAARLVTQDRAIPLHRPAVAR